MKKPQVNLVSHFIVEASEILDLHPEWVANGVQIIPYTVLIGRSYPLFNPGITTLITLQDVKVDNSWLGNLLLKVFPDNHQIQVFKGSESGIDNWQQLDLKDFISSLEPIKLMLIPALQERASLEQFMDTITRLRAPDGCPWDRQQTHTSLRPYLLEETYEALEALDNANTEALREELGDILLQIALHSVIGGEEGTFRISDVIAGIDRKIISRHPHVFSDVVVNGESDVLQNWDKLKQEERNGKDEEEPKGMLDGIPSILPALSQAQSIQQRAARVGFDWPEITPVLDKISEELEEVKLAQNKQEQMQELGDLLFAVVNLVRWYEVDAESALRLTNNKFRSRFAYIERLSRESGRELREMTLEEMDALWEEAKKVER